MQLHMAFLDQVHPRIRRLVETGVPDSWTVTFTASHDRADRAAAVADAEVAFIIGTGIDAALLERAPRLRFVQKLGAGIDRIDVAACAERGVAVARLEAGNSAQVAEHTILLMLSALRRLPYFDRTTRDGAWLKEEGRGVQRQLIGKRVGLIGLGAIGREVAKRLRGFDVEVVYHDPRPADAGTEERLGLRWLPLDELLTTSDILSLHLPLLPETRNFLDARRLSRLKPHATIINCARGGLIDEASLEAALDDGRILAVGLDTFTNEPPRRPSLLSRDNVVVTPHLAGATFENFDMVFRRGLRNVDLFLRRDAIAPPELVVAPPL